MRQPIIVLALYTLPCAGIADKGRLIRCGGPDPIYQGRAGDTTADEPAAHCKQLRAQMDAWSTGHSSEMRLWNATGSSANLTMPAPRPWAFSETRPSYPVIR